MDVENSRPAVDYAWQSLAGNGSISVRISSFGGASSVDKAGIMLRQDVSKDAPYYFAYVTPHDGVKVSYKVTRRARSVIVSRVVGAAPLYLRIARVRGAYHAYMSKDGKAWRSIDTMPTAAWSKGTVLAGIATASHARSVQTASVFSKIALIKATGPRPHVAHPADTARQHRGAGARPQPPHGH